MNTPKPKHIYIDPDTSLTTGDSAEKKLAQSNDKSFLEKGVGVVEVSEERWRLAQKAEKTYWMIKGLRTRDDRNYHHSSAFKGYQALKGRTFENALELGCGPFTNLRVMGNNCDIKQASLLDPLIESYLEHPYCSYTRESLRLAPRSYWGRKVHKLKPSWYYQWQEATGRVIPIKNFFALPIEAFSCADTYDLIVLLNVLEHCLSAKTVFDKILESTRPGSVFIFQDRLYHYEYIAQSMDYIYDAAHPLKVDKRVIENFLLENFKPLLHETQLEKDDFLLADQGTTEMLYFIGERK
jgi:SAM-dependent methyltransferase